MNEDLGAASVDQLVDAFADVARRMDEASIEGRMSRYRTLYAEKRSIETELRSRHGDQRRALLGLYDDPSMEVRLLAAKATRFIAPVEARHALERIRNSQWPQKLDAGMALRAWDEGIWQPD